jgi:hypothetical protein
MGEHRPRVKKSMSHYIAILVIVTLIGILFVPAVSAGKSLTYLTTKIISKPIPTANFNYKIPVTNTISSNFSINPKIKANTPLILPDNNNDRIGHDPAYQAFYNYLLQIDKYKANMSPWMEKIPSQILEMIDPNYPKTGLYSLSPNNPTISALIKEGVCKPAASLGKEGKITGDLFYVYIYLNPNTPLDIVDQYCYGEVTKSYGNDYIVAWVPLKNIQKIAEMNEVRCIDLVSPPEYQ